MRGGTWQNQENELKKLRNGTYELLEYNCLILQVAEKHWKACTVETELFKKIFDGEIET